MPPTALGGRPEYYITKLRGFNITDTRDIRLRYNGIPEYEGLGPKALR